MKQHITPEQLAELTEEQGERLRKWWEPIKHPSDWAHDFGGMSILPLLSIGQMIGLLAEKHKYFEIRWVTGETASCFVYYGPWNDKEKGELVDILWEAVKEGLSWTCL